MLSPGTPALQDWFGLKFKNSKLLSVHLTDRFPMTLLQANSFQWVSLSCRFILPFFSFLENARERGEEDASFGNIALLTCPGGGEMRIHREAEKGIFLLKFPLK